VHVVEAGGRFAAIKQHPAISYETKSSRRPGWARLPSAM
jgi:hypothetical protein